MEKKFRFSFEKGHGEVSTRIQQNISDTYSIKTSTRFSVNDFSKIYLTDL